MPTKKKSPRTKAAKARPSPKKAVPKRTPRPKEVKKAAPLKENPTSRKSAKLLLFVARNNSYNKPFTAMATELNRVTGIPLEILDAAAESSGRLIVGLNVYALPSLFLTVAGKKVLEFTALHPIEKMTHRVMQEISLHA